MLEAVAVLPQLLRMPLTSDRVARLSKREDGATEGVAHTADEFPRVVPGAVTENREEALGARLGCEKRWMRGTGHSGWGGYERIQRGSRGAAPSVTGAWGATGPWTRSAAATY